MGVLILDSNFVLLQFEELFSWRHWALVRHIVAALVVINYRASESTGRWIVLLLLALNFCLTTFNLNVLFVEVHHFLIPVGNNFVDFAEGMFHLFLLFQVLNWRRSLRNL